MALVNARAKTDQSGVKHANHLKATILKFLFLVLKGPIYPE